MIKLGTKLIKGNQWAALTEVTVENNMIDVSSHGESYPSFIQGVGNIRFSGIAPATPQILEVMKKWMYRENPSFPFYADEWMCLYCTSPNPLPKTHCSQCGAPRNWLIG